MTNKNLILLILLIFGLSACGTSTISKPTPELDQKIEAVALSMMEQGQYDQAATEYLRLATSYPERTIRYRLQAATAFFEARDLSNAKLILNETKINPAKSPIQNIQKNIILARIALLEDQAAQALNTLQQLPGDNIPNSLKVAFYETRSKAYQQQGLINESINERLTAYSVSDSNTESNIDNKQLWQDLNSLSLEELQTLKQTVDAKSQSWINLAIITKTNINKRESLESEIQLWQSDHPAHIANKEIIPDIFSKTQYTFTKAEKIALLLPLSGKFKKASEAIRDGFFSSWINNVAEKPEIKIYDTSSSDILQVYQAAISDGANVVVGPLQKQNVATLANSSDLVTTTTLVLNYLEESSSSDNNPALYQFGLSPEQEARQIAEQAQLQGYKTALVITPNSNWGSRLNQAFKSKFEELGGIVLKNSKFDNIEKNFDLTVKSLLNTDISRERSNKLRETLQLNIESETRRRHDADMIFLAAIHPHAKLILPHLYFQRARDIPVYASSNIHIFTDDPEDYVDMNKIIFTDIPSLLDQNNLNYNSTLKRYWPNASTTTHRLFALGYDSYSVIDQFSDLISNSNHSIDGATGKLKLNPDNKIHRKLQWGVIQDGEPTTLTGILYQ